MRPRARTAALGALVTTAALATSLVAALPARASTDTAPVGDSRETPESTGGAERTERTEQIIVHLDDPRTRSTAVVSAAAERAGVHSVGVRRLDEGTFVVRLTDPVSGTELDTLLGSLADQPGVASAVPDRRMQRSAAPNDPDYASLQWALKASVPASPYYSANVAPAWDITTGSSSVVVAVLDTGYTDHADLDPARLLPGYDFIADVDTANDGDGRDTDPHDPGDWITYTEANQIDGPFEDCFAENSSWHGTHVTGIIAATANNATGIAGIDWGARILPVRVLGKCGGVTSDIIDAMRWSAGLVVSGVPTNPNPAQVINLSLGGGTGGCSSAMQSAINDVIAAGAVVVTAAGNSNENAANNEPGNCAGVINVTSNRTDGFRASYANYGSTVTLAAPGGNGTCTTGIRSLYDTGTRSPSADSYKCLQGTSMATPVVSAAISLMRSVGPTLTPAQIRTLLTSTARAFPSPSYNSCVLQGCGAGILDVYAAVVAAGAFVIPDAPTALAAVPAPNTVTLSWDAPTDPPSYPVIDYVLQRSSNGGSTWTTINDPVSTVPSFAVTGLRNGTTYRFRVAARSSIGTSPWSTTINSRPAALPSAPRLPIARSRNQAVRLTWSTPYTSGGAPITDYVIQRSTDGLLWDEVDDGVSTATSRTVGGLVNGVAYRFRVAAVNSSGAGAWSTIRTARPRTVPVAPTVLTAAPRNTRASLTWLAPADSGGAPLQRYVLQRSSDGGVSWVTMATGTSLTPSYLARYLRNGRTYRFRVAAQNVAGRGPWSDVVTVRPRTTPGVPRSVSVTPGDTTFTLRWTAPSSNGGAPITAYRISISTDGATWTVLDTVDGALREYTASSLINDATVRVRIAAVNEAGAGPNSTIRSVTPTAAP